jgi:hypothetical protein
MPRAIRTIAITVGALAAVAVAVLVINRTEEIARHEHRVQAAYDSGRIDRARFQNASEAWQKGWNWQMNAQPFTSKEVPCAEELAGHPISKEEFEAFSQSDLARGCSSAQLQRSLINDMDRDETTAYFLGNYGLTR